MIVLAILATIIAFGWTVLVIGANGMRSSPGEFQGGGSMLIGWCIVAVLWLAWWVG